ncbi:hypothetical protein LCGC14_0463330 [marine sediment metagenome]|uniref:Endonuclease V n=1 Tax=marine sediment metagenome TaxID=412755 RepID=A0A0F9VN68_9ZZZZ|nr:MAG: Endonuclease V [Candidatus Lokiarchaeum sp. GC14_75]
MKHELLRDDYSIEQAESLQKKYRKLVLNIIDNNYINNLDFLKTIAGVDVSYYNKGDIEFGVVCAVLWSLEEEKMLTHQIVHNQVNFPYKPGFLGFRECKILAMAILKLPCIPDVIMCDGHGKIHPKRFGEAVHLGVALDIPTLGVAKNPYIGYSNWREIKKIKGNRSPIWEENPNLVTENLSNELLGYAICLNNGLKPVFVSCGYKITIKSALKICILLAKGHRQPEPLYLADRLSRNDLKRFVS